MIDRWHDDVADIYAEDARDITFVDRNEHDVDHSMSASVCGERPVARSAASHISGAPKPPSTRADSLALKRRVSSVGRALDL